MVIEKIKMLGLFVISGGEVENGIEIRNKYYNIICMCFIFVICFLLYFCGVFEYYLCLVFKCSFLVL